MYVLLRQPPQNDKYNYLPGLKVKTLLNNPRHLEMEILLEMSVAPPLGTGHATKSDEFSEKFQTASDPHLIFENCIAIFYDRYGCIYARRYDGQVA